MIKNFFAIIFAASIFLNCEITFAEDLRFIDASGDTGYYVDMDSVKNESSEVFFVDLIVIRADKNEMAVANLKINHKRRTYLVQSSKTLSYDERTELKTEVGDKILKNYSNKSLMNEIVQIILSNG